jgi:hypothetical protein
VRRCEGARVSWEDERMRVRMWGVGESNGETVRDEKSEIIRQIDSYIVPSCVGMRSRTQSRAQWGCEQRCGKGEE